MDNQSKEIDKYLLDLALETIFTLQEEFFGLQESLNQDDPDGRIFIRGGESYQVIMYIFNNPKALNINFFNNAIGGYFSPRLILPAERNNHPFSPILKRANCNGAYFLKVEGMFDSLNHHRFLPSSTSGKIDQMVLAKAAIESFAVHEFRHEFQGIVQNCKLFCNSDLDDLFSGNDLKFAKKFIANAEKAYIKSEKLPRNHIKIKREVDALIFGLLTERETVDKGNLEQIRYILGSQIVNI